MHPKRSIYRSCLCCCGILLLIVSPYLATGCASRGTGGGVPTTQQTIDNDADVRDFMTLAVSGYLILDKGDSGRAKRINDAAKLIKTLASDDAASGQAIKNLLDKLIASRVGADQEAAVQFASTAASILIRRLNINADNLPTSPLTPEARHVITIAADAAIQATGG